MSKGLKYLQGIKGIKWVEHGDEIYENPSIQFRWLIKKNGEKVLQQLWWQGKFDWEQSKPVWKDIEIVEEQ